MTIEVGNAVFQIGLFVIAIVFTLAMFHYNGIIWLAFVAALFWFIIGWYFNAHASGWDIYRMFAILSFGMVFVTVFSPLYSRGKHEDQPPPENVDEYMSKMKEYNDMINKYKGLRRRGR